MKKFDCICLMVVMLIAVSCTNDDADHLTQDVIIGTWKPIKEAVFADDGTPEVFDKTPCEQTSRFIFETNGNFTYTEFEDEEGGGCVPDESFILDGTWVKLGTGRYEFSFTYFNSSTQLGESDSQIPDKVVFSNANSTMRIIELVDEGEKYIELERVNQ